ncbi:MAG: DUF4397 domain-containing protein [Ardenticatenales bacterium]
MPRIWRLTASALGLVSSFGFAGWTLGAASIPTRAASGPTLCAAPEAPRDDMANVRLVGGLPTNTWLDMALDDEPVFKDLEYKDVGEYAETGAGNRVLRITPKGSSDPVIEGEIELAADTDYTVAVAGTVADVEAFIYVDDNTATEAGEARIRLVHLAYGAPALDVLAGDTALWENVVYGDDSEYVRLDAGTYSVDVREAGTSNVLLPADDMTVEAGAIYTLFVLGHVDGAPPLMLLQSTDAADLPRGDQRLYLPALFTE